MSGTPAYIQAVGINRQLVAGATALLHDTHEKLLLNCGESLQRLATEWRLRVSKVSNVVVTQLDPAYIGGLVGLLLTVEGIEAPLFDLKAKRTQARVEKDLEPLGLAYADVVNKKEKFNSKWVESRWRNVVGDCSLLNPTAPAGSGRICVWWRPLMPKFCSTSDAAGGQQTYEDYCKLRHSVRSLRVWGPPGLSEILKSHVQLTARLGKLALEIVEVIPSAELPSATLTKDLFSQMEFNLSLWPIPAVGGAQHQQKKRKFAANDSAASTVHAAIPLISGQGKKQLGKFLVEKAQALRVPPGPLFARLKHGESVKLLDGTEIHSSQVCEEPLDGLRYLVTHCIDEKQVAEVKRLLTTEPALITHVAQMRESGGFIYNLGLEVFSEDADVTVSNDLDMACPTSIQQITLVQRPGECTALPYVAQQGLNLALRELLPALHPLASWEQSDENKLFLRRFPLVPRSKIELANLPVVDVAQLINREKEELLSKIDSTLRAKVSEVKICSETTVTHTCGRCFSASGIRLNLLGTGAAVPSKFRNVSSALIAIEPGCNIMLDCGEGTLTQLQHLYGAAADEVIAAIRMVFISHKHGDHINGLPSLLTYREKLVQCAPLKVVAPFEMQSWFAAHCGDAFDFHDCADYTATVWVPLFDTGSVTVSIRTAYVTHMNCGPDQSACFGCRIRLSLGARKLSCNPLLGPTQKVNENCETCSKEMDLAFTGDMMPNADFTSLISDEAKPLHVLLHEATFEDDLSHEAVARRHSTISDCFQAADSSKSKLLVMTHFSQRYPCVAGGAEAEARDACAVAHGLDFLSIPLSSLWNGSLDPEVQKGLQLDRAIIACLKDKLESAVAMADEL